ncbi:hypothetical protein TWF696_003296 [Orbilia brochopaga]|uniref:Uncharacterized protein n=1 Tax=Orbilia brochopaga TaxID=3140254 RepID=A0AAV9TY42_9PEZI
MKILYILSLAASAATAQRFIIQGGQIYTPGLAIIDAPQPFTPLGGETLHIALDVSGNGRLPSYTYQARPDGSIPFSSTTGTYYHNITIFLVSFTNGHNLTISNNTVPSDNGYIGPVLALEPGSTVKHVNWIWPSCLMRGMGEYNISIHQSFVYNSTGYYSVFDLPISLTNEIPAARDATDCGVLNNPLVGGGSSEPSVQPWLDGAGAIVVGGDNGPNRQDDNDSPDTNDGNGSNDRPDDDSGNRNGNGSNNDGAPDNDDGGNDDGNSTTTDGGNNGNTIPIGESDGNSTILVGDGNTTSIIPDGNMTIVNPNSTVVNGVNTGGGIEFTWALGFVGIVMILHHVWTFILS